MNIKIEIKNLDKFERALSRSPQIIGRHLQRAIETAGYVFLARTRENIRTGRNMWKAPIDTGYMWNHIFTNIFPLKTEIFATADYAVFVHEGTQYMQARPFFDITEQTALGEIEGVFRKELNNALEEVAHG